MIIKPVSKDESPAELVAFIVLDEDLKICQVSQDRNIIFIEFVGVLVTFDSFFVVLGISVQDADNVPGDWA